MDTKKIEKLIELIVECVGDKGKTWREKAEEVRAEADESEMISLEEFASWFEPEDEE